MRQRGRIGPEPVADAAALRVPLVGAGQCVGLFGGSFNPPHKGHRHVALTALHRLSLDAVWWLVTPGNPLKSQTGLAPLADRVAMARRRARHPRMKVTAFEAAIGTRYSADTIRFLESRYPTVRFVWLMGADNLADFHRWQEWREIMGRVPVGVVDRPGASRSALYAPAARAFAASRLLEGDAAALPFRAPPAWVFLHGPLEPLSSTVLRAQTKVFQAAS
ncbi:nicotinate-nucleotide adenylyltransferase [Acuticoccus sp. MNP-M23]|uniref:nicotinate-nucleotide adenylyltransferase n=1 Tax=Acuticoccus sp. MNP-M23 TaxID=3072793 RepID=UPI002815F381|nr:nicotinate-nucleotide adenylyltransferase [Acuticoccus sp. MNP-M23]WMS42676.1 nicotinate-nucleotide adenylyltransferase [Acuticoccus sp. MNP-M23]